MLLPDGAATAGRTVDVRHHSRSPWIITLAFGLVRRVGFAGVWTGLGLGEGSPAIAGLAGLWFAGRAAELDLPGLVNGRPDYAASWAARRSPRRAAASSHRMSTPIERRSIVRSPA